MSGLRLPTVEVFSDIDSVGIDVAPALSGIDMVSEIAGKLELANTERKFRLGLGADMIDDRQIRWPKLTADLNVVLTDKQFAAVKDNGARVTGRAYFGQEGSRVALVSTDSNFVNHTVAHEIGHLFGLKNLQNTSGNAAETGHCSLPGCVMVAMSETYEYEIPRQTTMPRRWLERLGIAERQYDIQPETSITEFCGSCAGDLRKAAITIFMVKNSLNSTSSIY